MNKIKELKEKIDNSKKINYKNANDILVLLKKILKVLLFVVIIIGIFITLKVCSEIKIASILLTILSIIKPFFIGIIVAWLLNPIVNFLQRKGIRRGIGAGLSYAILIGLVFIIVYSIIPIIYNQLKDLTSTIPMVLESVENIFTRIVAGFKGIDIDVDIIKNSLYNKLDNVTNNVYTVLPNAIIKGFKTIVSGMGACIIGLIIGFYLLLGFNNIEDSLLIFVPKKFQVTVQELFSKITKVLRGYVNGALFDASIIFVFCSILFLIIGVKSPILFALFCGIMNVIPYVGPYIGAIPALIVAFSQSFTIGILATISIIGVQMVEGNILSPIVMSKTTKLHPVSIILGLLVFGHFFGIIGMLLSTPIIAVLKVIIDFVTEKYHIFNEVPSKEEI